MVTQAEAEEHFLKIAGVTGVSVPSPEVINVYVTDASVAQSLPNAYLGARIVAKTPPAGDVKAQDRR